MSFNDLAQQIVQALDLATLIELRELKIAIDDQIAIIEQEGKPKFPKCLNGHILKSSGHCDVRHCQYNDYPNDPIVYVDRNYKGLHYCRLCEFTLSQDDMRLGQCPNCEARWSCWPPAK